MAGHRLFLEAGDLRIGQAGEVVEALVVLAHMIEAKLEIFALAQAADRRAVRAGLPAAVPLADGRARLKLRVGVAPYADLFEIFRIGFHSFRLWDVRRAKQELTFG